MQTFLPYTDFRMSAHVLDQKRLGKQRVECLQILRTLKCGPIQRSFTPSLLGGFKYNPQEGCYTRRTPWYNHPAVQQWKGYERALMKYTYVVCEEWINRGFNDTVLEKASMLHFNKRVCIPSDFMYAQMPPWLGMKVYHASHRSNLLRKMPEWYSRFEWTEPSTLPYVWPSKL